MKQYCLPQSIASTITLNLKTIQQHKLGSSLVCNLLHGGMLAMTSRSTPQQYQQCTRASWRRIQSACLQHCLLYNSSDICVPALASRNYTRWALSSWRHLAYQLLHYTWSESERGTKNTRNTRFWPDTFMWHMHWGNKEQRKTWSPFRGGLLTNVHSEWSSSVITFAKQHNNGIVSNHAMLCAQHTPVGNNGYRTSLLTWVLMQCKVHNSLSHVMHGTDVQSELHNAHS